MRLDGLLPALAQTGAFQSLLKNIEDKQPLVGQQILRSARPYVTAAIADALNRPILLITDRVDRAYNITEQLPVWLPERTASRFLESSAAFYERAPWSEEVLRARLNTLGLLLNYEKNTPCPIIVTSAEALMQKTLPVREFRAGSRKLKVGQVQDPDKLIRLWLDLGYEATTIVAQAGQFTRRGGIIDVFPATQTAPIRIEFFGDEIESMRRFDAASQRSLERIDTLTFSPTREALPKFAPKVAEKLKNWFMSQPTDDEATSLRPDYEVLQQGIPFPLLEFYLPWLYSQPASILDYLPENTLVLVEDWNNLHDSIASAEEEAIALREDKIRQNLLPEGAPLAYHTWDSLAEKLESFQTVYLGQSANPVIGQPEGLGALFIPDSRFGGQIRLVLDHLRQLRRNGEQTITVTRQAEHLALLWSEANNYIPPVENIAAYDTLGMTTFVQGELGEGWVLKAYKKSIHLLTDAEIFGWKRPEPRRHQRPKSITPETAFADLSVGDYVVHVEFGIGRFVGLIRRSVDGLDREFLKLEYADGDTLFVPIHQAERVTRYVGGENTAPPRLHKLGTQEWHQTRKKASEAAEAYARELLELYAKRASAQGHAFNPDTPWQHELEASFPYVETDDQLQAIREVKQDMESSIPMDRLICGDVGFGKTEIAVRAAFKAVTDGKQVALLVPTTILAQQHYQTFTERMASFPVKVEMISRFRTEEEQREIIKALADGTVDIVIGTHRLLSQDVKFEDLGLLVIDEEQRFGITHKEQLKQLRANLDILTLTATPIPRTLYLGITGLRDISVIQTAPEERLPIATHVGMYDDRLVRQAILREIDRGGQVFFVHNRVRTIKAITRQLENLIPEATFAIAHGQMNEHQLEKIMRDFSHGEYDVLVSTSIIESGLDIPNANTMIIDRADWFGLAELYQLRGRVGRSANQAYAYFFHPSTSKLTEEARARLETIGEETQLGAGLSIAMRDLELRGAGDILGKRQSGHITAVGFHLYTQLLAQAIQKLKTKANGAKPTPPTPTSIIIDLPLPTYIPPDYVEDTALRIQLYRRLADLHELKEVKEMASEFNDRFGPMPRAVECLLFQLQVKIEASHARATAVVTEQGKIAIKLPYLGQIDRERLQAELGADVRVSRTAIFISREGGDDEAWMVKLLDVLEKLGQEALAVTE